MGDWHKYNIRWSSTITTVYHITVVGDPWLYSMHGPLISECKLHKMCTSTHILIDNTTFLTDVDESDSGFHMYSMSPIISSLQMHICCGTASFHSYCANFHIYKFLCVQGVSVALKTSWEVKLYKYLCLKTVIKADTTSWYPNPWYTSSRTSALCWLLPWWREGPQCLY